MSLSGTATQWTILNPVLAVGEIGYETDTGKTKKGDGVTPWASLAYDGTTYPKGAPVTDANGNTVISLDTVASAVNFLRVIAGATGSPVMLRVDGADINCSLVLRPNGTGKVQIVDGANTLICSFNRVSSAVNYWELASSATGNALTATALGTDPNIGINIVTKAAGRLRAALAPRVGTVASSSAPGINVDNIDQFNFTALAVAVTSMTSGLSGTPADGQRLRVRFKDDGTGRAITWGASYTGTLLSTTVASKTHIQELIYDAAAAKWVGVYADATGY